MAPEDARPRSILLVEDEALIALGEKNELERYGYAVTHVLGGEDAVRAALEEGAGFDLILMDINLGAGMDGTRAAAEILERRDVPVVFLSSYTERAVVEKTEGITSYGYVVKNTGITVLDAAIKMALKLHAANRALRESEERYKTIVASMSDLIFVIDEEDRFIDVHYRSADTLMLPPEEFLGKKMSAVMPANFNELYRACAARVRLTGENRRFEYSLPIKGETRWFVASLDLHPHGRRIVAGIRDITDRKKAEDALREREEHLRFLAENMADIVWTLDRDLRITYISPSILKVLGMTPEERANQSLQEMMTPAAYRQVLTLVADELRRDREPGVDPERLIVFDLELLHADGHTVWIENRVRPMQDADGAVIGFYGSSRDITDRKKAEDALHEREERLRFLAENMADIVWTLDRDLKTTYVSPSILKVLGFTPEERMRQRLEEMVTPASYRRATALLAEELARDTEQGADPDRYIAVEVEYLHADGHTVWMENRVKAMRDADGAIVGIYGSSRDITERKRAEESQRAETARRRAEAGEIARIALSADLAEGRVRELARDLTETGARVLEVERTGVWFFDGSGSRLVEADTYTASSGTHSSGAILREQEYRAEFDALRRDKFIDAHDALTDPRVAGYVETYLKPNRITSMLDAVIRAGGRNLGVLCFEHVDREHRWQDDEISFACQLADQAALAVDRRERRRAEGALRESEEKYRLLVENSFELIWNMTAEGVFTYVSPSCERILGYAPESMIGKHFQPFVHPEDAPVCLASFQKIKDSRESLPIPEYRVRHADGSWRWHVATTMPVIEQDGRCSALVGVSRDITERKRVEETLGRSEERYRSILEAIEDGYYEVDLAGNFTFFNDSLCRMMGYPRDELMGMNNRQYTDGENLRKLYRAFNQVYKTGKPLMDFDWEVVRKDGTPGTGQASISLIRDSAGAPCGFRGIARDITERKRAEDTIKYQLKEKEILLKEVHHRIKNNIASIAGMLRLMANSTASGEAKSVLFDAISRVESMQKLYQRLLLAEDYRSFPARAYIHDLLESIIGLFPQEQHVTIRKHLEDFSLSVKQLFHLGLIINELITNSVKYAFDGSKGAIIDVSLSMRGNTMTLTVRDNGKGLPDGFDPDKSAGFGLMLVKMLALQLNGVFSMVTDNGTKCVVTCEI